MSEKKMGNFLYKYLFWNTPNKKNVFLKYCLSIFRELRYSRINWNYFDQIWGTET